MSDPIITVFSADLTCFTKGTLLNSNLIACKCMLMITLVVRSGYVRSNLAKVLTVNGFSSPEKVALNRVSFSYL